MLFEKLHTIVLDKLSHELADNLYYHGVHHTLDVLKSIEKIGLAEKVSKQEMELLKMAALFHDIGFIESYKNNEFIGAAIAKEELEKLNYPKNIIDQVLSLILSTQIKKEPINLLEEIMSDSDFDYFGRNDFHEISETLRLELNANGYNFSLMSWDEVQVKFLNKHKYYTNTAKKTRLPKKLDNLAEIKNRLKTY